MRAARFFAFLAATYLVFDSQRTADDEMVEHIRRRRGTLTPTGSHTVDR